MFQETPEEREERERRALLEQNEQAKANSLQERVKKEERLEELTVEDIPLPENLPHNGDLKELAQAVESEIFNTYYRLMKHPKTPASVKKACADALADRAKGRAEQAITQTVKHERPDADMDMIARMMAFAYRDSMERGTLTDVIDVTPEKEDEQ